jgi:AcrR family transcriptional regulator
MRRASTQEKKQERRADIIAHARGWIASRAFDEIRLTDLARELGLVKGTLYLYFPTKHDLFASILIEEMEAWWAELPDTPPRGGPGRYIATGLAGRGLLVRLLSSLHMSIEPGLTPEGLRGMKRWFAGFARRAAADLGRRFPALGRRSFEFVLGVYALALGTSQLAFPPENVRALIDRDEELGAFRVDFGAFLSVCVDALYKGMTSKGARAARTGPTGSARRRSR